MNKPTCETCKWWRRDFMENETTPCGACVRYPPHPAAERTMYWPLTHPLDLCGEHEPRRDDD